MSNGSSKNRIWSSRYCLAFAMAAFVDVIDYNTKENYTGTKISF